MEPSVPCGPYDRSLLTFQDKHVSTDVWAGNERGKLILRQGTSRLLDWVIKEPQKRYIESWGFKGFKSPCSILQNDVGLISALVERWRPETNSFHFPVGEMTITLEDVFMLLGLPVRGKPIIYERLDRPKSYFLKNWPDSSLNLKQKKELYGKSGISLKKLRDRYKELPNLEEGDEESVKAHSLAYVLYVIGSVLFADNSQDVVHPKYLQLLLQQQDDSIPYAWGAGVLGFLYKGLYKASRKESTGIEGCLTLLQLWSYERILPGRPTIAPEQEYTWPRIVAWGKYVEDRYENPHHHLRVYRGQFDTFDPRWLTWEPYAKFYMTEDDEYEVGPRTGLARVPLIHWNIVEYHMPDRVLRQFGKPQHIPDPPTVVWERRAPLPRFDKEVYIVINAAYIREWNQFLDEGAHVVGVNDACPIEDYMRWYINLTKLRISRYDHYDPRIIQQPRDWCNQLQMVNTMTSAVNLLEEIHRRDPPDYFYDLIPSFLSHFDKAMTEMHGPGFERPTFERRTRRKVVEPIVHDVPVTMSDNTMHDVSTSRVLKFSRDYFLDKFGLDTKEDKLIDVQRQGGEMKGDMKRPLKNRKSRWLFANWWSKDDIDVEPISHLNLNYELHKPHLMTLEPQHMVQDEIINAYFELLREREKHYIVNKQFENQARHFFMHSEFMEASKKYVKDLKKHPLDRSAEELEALKSFLLTVSVQLRGNRVDDCEFIYFPTCLDQHWFLFIWSVVDQRVILLDSLRNDTKNRSLKKMYSTQYYIMERLVPCMLHFVNKERYPEPIKWGKVKQLKNRPMQTDNDCGIFVCKYVDASLMGLPLEHEKWSKEDVCNFRYRIAWEISKGQARHLPSWSIEWRKKFPRKIGV